VAKNKKRDGSKNGPVAETAVAENPVDEAPKTNIPIPGGSGVSRLPQGGAQPEVRELTDAERLRSQNFAAQEALIKEQEQNIALQEQNVKLQAENLKLRKELLGRAKKETEGEKIDWLRDMGVGDGDNVALRDGKLMIQRSAAK
jgi:hypothetical protein